MFVSSKLFFRRKDISVLFWFLFSFWRGFVYFLPLEWVGDCFLVFSTTDFFSSVSRPGCISSLYALSRSLSLLWKMTEITDFLLCCWDLSATGLFPSFLLGAKTAWSPRGVVHSVQIQRWGSSREWPARGSLVLPPRPPFPFWGSGFQSDSHTLTW